MKCIRSHVLWLPLLLSGCTCLPCEPGGGNRTDFAVPVVRRKGEVASSQLRGVFPISAPDHENAPPGVANATAEVAVIPSDSHFAVSDVKNVLARNGIECKMFGSLIWSVFVKVPDRDRAIRILRLRDELRGVALASKDSDDDYLLSLREGLGIGPASILSMKRERMLTEPFTRALVRPPVIVGQTLSSASSSMLAVDPMVARLLGRLQADFGWGPSDLLEWMIVDYVPYWSTPVQQSTGLRVVLSLVGTDGVTTRWAGEVWEESGIMQFLRN